MQADLGAGVGPLPLSVTCGGAVYLPGPELAEVPLAKDVLTA